MCRHGCGVKNFRMVTENIPGEAAPEIQRNPWDKVLTDGQRQDTPDDGESVGRDRVMHLWLRAVHPSTEVV